MPNERMNPYYDIDKEAVKMSADSMIRVYRENAYDATIAAIQRWINEGQLFRAKCFLDIAINLQQRGYDQLGRKPE